MLALGVSYLGACSDEAPMTVSRGSSEPALVEITVASIQSMDRRAEAVGTLIGNESVVITAKVTEQVSAVFFEGGEFVVRAPRRDRNGGWGEHSGNRRGPDPASKCADGHGGNCSW